MPYYLFVLVVFGLSLYLVYLLTQKISRDGRLALLTLFFYGFSATNFTRIYFLSAFQEIVMVVFVLLACLFYLKNKSLKNILFSLLFFVLALASKETAVVLPGILLLADWLRGEKIRLKKIFPYILILAPYLCLRLLIFGGAAGESYLWDFSPKRALNTLFWYILWSFGAPELLVDYVSSGFRILPRFFSDFPLWSYMILGVILPVLVSFLFIIPRRKKEIDKLLIFGVAVFVLGLLPVLFLPWHKFTLELALPMFGFSLMLAELCRHRKRIASLFIFFFLFLNLQVNLFTYKTHYSVNRSRIARKLYHFFVSTYPQHPEDEYFEFINDSGVSPQTWGSSKQIAQVTANSNFFEVLYNKRVAVFFDDFPDKIPSNLKIIKISTKFFLE